MPPSIVLEVLKITEAEMELRDLTREVEQARSALEEGVLEQSTLDDRARALADEQEDIVFRTETVIEAIGELPDGSETFGRELKMLAAAQGAMEEAYEFLDDGLTGPETIAAETEAIELLLQSRRGGKGGGGGGGASPGGGGGGTDGASALALAGRSSGAGEHVAERDVRRTTSRTISRIPIEFQEALDRYFEALEGR